MNQPFRTRMIDATRLVRTGQIAEATALLQDALRSGPMAFRKSATDEPDGTVPALPAPAGVASRVRSAGAFGLPTGGLVDGVLSDIRKALGGLQGRASPEPDTPVPADAGGAETGSFVEARFSNGTGSRPYKLFIPSASAPHQPLPLVVMLHGCTQSPDDFAAGTRMNELAEREGFLVCYPAQTAAANGSRCWNWFNDGDQHRDRGEPSLIAGITRDVMQRHPVDPARVYVAGLSAGGALAATMGQAYPDLYAAVGVHSGLACGAAHDMGSAFKAMRQGGGTRAAGRGAVLVPTIVFHGDHDQTVNPVNGDEVVAQTLGAADATAEIEDHAFPGRHGFRVARFRDRDGNVAVERWTIHGAGHAWAGGSPTGSYTDPQGPNASAEMVRFFLQNRHS